MASDAPPRSLSPTMATRAVVQTAEIVDRARGSQGARQRFGECLDPCSPVGCACHRNRTALDRNRAAGLSPLGNKSRRPVPLWRFIALLVCGLILAVLAAPRFGPILDYRTLGRLAEPPRRRCTQANLEHNPIGLNRHCSSGGIHRMAWIGESRRIAMIRGTSDAETLFP